jgi:hypothetical protein
MNPPPLPDYGSAATQCQESGTDGPRSPPNLQCRPPMQTFDPRPETRNCGARRCQVGREASTSKRPRTGNSAGFLTLLPCSGERTPLASWRTTAVKSKRRLPWFGVALHRNDSAQAKRRLRDWRAKQGALRGEVSSSGSQAPSSGSAILKTKKEHPSILSECEEHHPNRQHQN